MVDYVNEDHGIGVKLIRKEEQTIDKIVYSLWTKPSGGNILEKAVNWYSPKAQLLCLALSVHKSAEHFSKVELVTDSEGWDIIKELNLPFTSVKTILDDIPEEQFGFWALGKIYAYQAQDEPFIHLDNDAILWDGLPDWAKKSELFVQNTEDKDWFEGSYRAEVRHASKVLEYFPPNWNKTSEAYCTGIFGGTDIEFIKDYCAEALKFINDPRNRRGWFMISNKGSYCIIFEQYLLACMADSHSKNVTFFDKFLDKKKLASYGYTHIWGAKKEKNIETLLTKSLGKHYPEALKQVEKLF